MVVIVLVRWVIVFSVRRFDFRYYCAAFICVYAIQTCKVYTIRYKKSNQLSSLRCTTGVVGILVTIIISNMLTQPSNV